MKIAVVGLGKMGLLHASLLNTIPGIQITAFCEKKTIVRQGAKKILKGIDVVGEVAQLRNYDLDAVYIATPPLAHHPIVKELFTLGIVKNIFVEKPLASNIVQSDELCTLSDSQGVTMVGYNRRFAVTFSRAKEIIEEGTLGKPVSFDAYAYSSDLLGTTPGSNVAGGSVLKDLGCHAIDLSLWFFGDMKVETAVTDSVSSSGLNDCVCISLKNSSGLAGMVKSSWYMKDYRLPEIGLMIRGSKGTLTVNDDRLELRMDNGNSSVWHRHDLGDNVGFFLGRSDYFREDDTFVKAIAKGVRVIPDFRTASKVDYIISQAEERINHA
jgi:predicted dehydrogenase